MPSNLARLVWKFRQHRLGPRKTRIFLKLCWLCRGRSLCASRRCWTYILIPHGISPIKWPYSSTKTPCHFIGRLAIKWCVNLVACGQNYVGRHIDRGLPVLTFDFIGVRWYEPRFYSRPSLTIIRSWFLNFARIHWKARTESRSWSWSKTSWTLTRSIPQISLKASIGEPAIKRIALDIRTIRRTHRGKNLLIADAVRFCKPNPYKFTSQPSWTQTTHYKINSRPGQNKVKTTSNLDHILRLISDFGRLRCWDLIL